MIVKLFEVRDSGTFLPMIAIKLNPQNEAERYLLARSGYGLTAESHQQYILMAAITDNGILTYDQYSQPNRTRQVAHDYVITHFDELQNGQVIDVEFILGIKPEPKLSESITANL